MEARAELTGGGVDVFFLDRANRQAKVTRQDQRIRHALVAPVLAEFVGLHDHAVRFVFFGNVGYVLFALAHGALLHGTRADARFKIMTGNRAERRLPFPDLDFFASGQRAVAVAVGND